MIALFALLAATAVYAPAPCPVETVAGENITCGKLTVPENRHKLDSRTIDLPVMIFHSRTATPAADPVIFLPGGPGGSATRQKSGKNNPFLDDRDYILLEPRGAKYATPALECPEVNRLKGVISAGHLRGDDADSALARAAGDCRAALTARGVDLDGYTSAETAQDIEDLRVALKIDKWNVFGHSYGTRLALTYLRDHPAGVRSVLLDSVLPPEARFDEQASANLRRSLNAALDGCAVDAECAASQPHLASQLAQVLAEADTHPIAMPDILGSDGQPVEVRGAEIVDALYSALHDTGAIGQIPSIVNDIAQQRYDRLHELVKNNQGPSSFTWGLRLSVWCGEEMPFENSDAVEAQTASGQGLSGIDERTASVAMCRAWNVSPADAIEALPVKSDVPVLILAGEFDPDTPPAWGRDLLANMPNARFVLMAGQSHGAGFNRCGAAIETAFLRDPSASLNTDCALKLPGADFSQEPAQ